MRKTLRQAKRKASAYRRDLQAWHVPALERKRQPSRTTTAQGLPKMKVAATWTPWTYAI
ncbi:MAG: DUF5682 family protein [Bilophila wadsworthia]